MLDWILDKLKRAEETMAKSPPIVSVVVSGARPAPINSNTFSPFIKALIRGNSWPDGECIPDLDHIHFLSAFGCDQQHEKITLITTHLKQRP